MNLSLSDKDTPRDLTHWLAELAPLARRADYAWLREIVESTLNQRVVHELETEPPRPLRLRAARVEEHLREAGALLDQCLKLRDQIFDLEARALVAALEYQATEANFDSDLVLAKLQLQALRKEAGADAAQVSDDEMLQRSERSRTHLAVRLALHNVPGGALNFGERVGYLRRIYIDTLRAAVERIVSARVGLQTSFGVSTEKIAQPALWDGEVSWLVLWVRKAIRAFEEGTQSEVINTVFFKIAGQRLFGYRLSTEADTADRDLGIPVGERVFSRDPRADLASPGDADLEFIITPDDLPSVDRTQSRAYRVIGASASIVLDEHLRNSPPATENTEVTSKQQVAEARRSRFVESASFPGSFWRPRDGTILGGLVKIVRGPVSSTVEPPTVVDLNPERADDLTGVFKLYPEHRYELPGVPLRMSGTLLDLPAVEIENEPLFGPWVLRVGATSNFPFRPAVPGFGPVREMPTTRQSIIGTINWDQVEIVVAFQIAHRRVVHA